VGGGGDKCAIDLASKNKIKEEGEKKITKKEKKEKMKRMKEIKREEAMLFPPRPTHTHIEERVSTRKEERKAPRGVGRLGSIMRGHERRRS
jgi:hypothetical protein